MKAPKTKRPRWGAWALAWIGLLTFGAKAPCLFAMNNGMTDLEYATAWYSITQEERYQIVMMRSAAAAAYPNGPNEGTSAFDVYTDQIAGDKSPRQEDIPSAIQAVALFIDESNADDTTKEGVATNDLFHKVTRQIKLLKTTASSLTKATEDCSERIGLDNTTICNGIATQNIRLGNAPAGKQEDGFLKRLEAIQGVKSGEYPNRRLSGGLIGDEIPALNEKFDCDAKIQEITKRINQKIKETDPTKPTYATLALAVNTLDLLGDCSVFAKQIDARTPLKVIPKAVEAVVGDFDSESSMNPYGLIGPLTTDGYPVTTKDIYQRLKNALTLLDDALHNKFDNYPTPDTTPTLQGIIEKLLNVPLLNP